MSILSSMYVVQATAAVHRTLMTGAKLRIYAGAVPETADDSVGSAVLLAELTLNVFSEPVDGQFHATSITAEPSIRATDTATFYRTYSTQGDCLGQGTIGTADADMIMNSTAFIQGGRLGLDTFSHRISRWEGEP